MLEPTPETSRYWQALEGGRLVAERCTKCHALQSYPRRFCESCGGEDRNVVDLGQNGVVYSFSVLTRVTPGFVLEPPYAVALIEFAEGHRIVAPVGGNLDNLRIGATVELRPRSQDSLTLPCFEVVP